MTIEIPEEEALLLRVWELEREFKKFKAKLEKSKEAKALTRRFKRGFNRSEAADYIGVGTTKFEDLVNQRRMPQPRLMDKRMVWDVCELDEYFEKLPQRGDERVWHLD